MHSPKRSTFRCFSSRAEPADITGADFWGIVSVGIYTFMISWNEYLFALTLTKTDDMRTVPIGIQLLMGQHSYEWNEMMAMSILGSIPVLVLFLLFQRYFIGGMTAGSVKS